MTQLELQRRLRGIKQGDLAKAMGLSQEFVSGVERRLMVPSRNFKRRASKALRLPEKFLFSEIGV